MPSHFLKRSTSGRRKPKPKDGNQITVVKEDVSKENIENDPPGLNTNTEFAHNGSRISQSPVFNVDTCEQRSESPPCLKDAEVEQKIELNDTISNPLTGNHCTETTQLQTIYTENDLHTVYFELLEKYKSLLALRKSSPEFLFNEYKEAAEKRFKASESLIEKLQKELQCHTCSSNTDESSQHDRAGKRASIGLTPNDSILDLYGRMFGITITPTPGDDICWKISMLIPTKNGGSFEFLLREQMMQDDGEPAPRMMEYIPITLASNNQCREQCLRGLPKNPPSYLLEEIAFKSSALPIFMFNLGKWLRSSVSTMPSMLGNEAGV